MQIISLWLKISAFLAILGWAVHVLNPEFAAWFDGLFAKDPVAVNETVTKDAAAPENPEPQIPRPPTYKLND